MAIRPLQLHMWLLSTNNEKPQLGSRIANPFSKDRMSLNGCSLHSFSKDRMYSSSPLSTSFNIHWQISKRTPEFCHVLRGRKRERERGREEIREM